MSRSTSHRSLSGCGKRHHIKHGWVVGRLIFVKIGDRLNTREKLFDLLHNEQIFVAVIQEKCDSLLGRTVFGSDDPEIIDDFLIRDEVHFPAFADREDVTGDVMAQEFGCVEKMAVADVRYDDRLKARPLSCQEQYVRVRSRIGHGDFSPARKKADGIR